MRRIVAICGASAVLAALVTGTVVVWRRNPRIGTTFVNAVVNPGLLRRGFAGGEKSEIGTIEHFGRKTGTRRLTPVHPEPIPDGYRIVVPLGEHSEWARNVLAAGHCRLQLHDHVYELDEPAMIQASDARDLPRIVRGVMQALGFQYLTLRTFAVNAGVLKPLEPRVDLPEPANAGLLAVEASLV
jgi:deazaflavin-dependent oxidoreductase (nitroreductase family)